MTEKRRTGRSAGPAGGEERPGAVLPAAPAEQGLFLLQDRFLAGC